MKPFMAELRDNEVFVLHAIKSGKQLDSCGYEPWFRGDKSKGS